MRIRRLLHCLLAAALALAGVTPAGAQGRTASVEEVKAQVLARVLLFVHWPGEESAATAPLKLCTVGETALGSALATLDGQPVKERPLQVRRSGADRLSDCHIAYLGASAQSTQPALEALRGKPVLTVVEGPLQPGAMVSLQIEGTRVGFDVGLGAARAAGIEISAKLLRLARFVKED